MHIFRSLIISFGAGVLFALAPHFSFAQSAAASTEPSSTASAAKADLPLDSLPLDGASRYRTRAQQMLAELVAGGETDIDQLVAVIATDNRETLDHIVINLATQRIYECNLEGQLLNEQPISSGRRGLETPPGEYKVVNKAPKAYSEKYTAWMLHWMGLTADGGYGMHGLEGSSYERLLGGVASHGCIRLSRAYAKDLYSRVKVGMPVSVVNDPQLKLDAYEPLSRQAALSIVLEAISPADPWEIFY